MSSRSPAANPFCTKAEYSPDKINPYGIGRALQCQSEFHLDWLRGQAAASMAIGVTEMRL